MTSLLKSEQGKNKILNLYNEKFKELNIEYQNKRVETLYGKTNIIISGKSSNPPIFIIHGLNGCEPFALETYPNLSLKFKVYVIDVIGQPNKRKGKRLSMKDDSYGKWINEIINKLNLRNVTMLGFSFDELVNPKILGFEEKISKKFFLSRPSIYYK